MSRFRTAYIIVICTLLASCAPAVVVGTPFDADALPPALQAPLAPSLAPTATMQPGTPVFQKLELEPGLTLINKSGKAIMLRKEMLHNYMEFAGAEISSEWPVEIVIVAEQATLIEIHQRGETSGTVTTFSIAAEDERSLNAGMLASVGLIRSTTADPAYLTTFAVSAEDMGMINTSLLTNMSYNEYVTWALDERHVPLTGSEGVSMDAMWANFKEELNAAGVTELPLFIP